MDSRFFQVFVEWYLISIDILLIVGIIYFLKLPKEKKVNSYFWLPFLILSFTVFYENFGAYSIYNFEFNKAVNALLGNTENPRYNVWLYNIFNIYILTFLYLFLIRLYVNARNRKIINGMMIFYLMAILFFNSLGIEKVYDNQPIIFFIGASFLIIASGLYFMMFIKEDIYLDINPLRLFSFWQVTFILFNYSTVFLLFISRKYLWENYYSLFNSLSYISIIFGIIILVIFLATITWPSLNWKYEKQPTNV